MSRKTIELDEIGPEFCLDTLYANDDYSRPFVIETNYGMVYTVRLVWVQGLANNYRFVIGTDWSPDESLEWIHPGEVKYIEVR